MTKTNRVTWHRRLSVTMLLLCLGPACEGTHSLAQSETTQTDWRLPDQPYRRRLQLDNRQQMAGDLVKFPAALILDASFEYAMAAVDGSNLRFVDPGTGQIVPHEIETWAPGGKSIVWFRAPRLAAASNANFVDLYFGSTMATSVQGSERVFSDGYVGVYHLAADLRDSSAQGNDGLDRGTMAESAGQVGQARLFPGGEGKSVAIDDKGFSAGREPRTLCAWARANQEGPEYFNVVAYGVGNAGFSILQHGDLLWVWCGDLVQVPKIFIMGVDRYICASHDGQRTTVLVDGVTVAQTMPGSWDLQLGTAQIGGTILPTGSVNAQMGSFRGVIDEVRISNVARSTDWIAAEFRSMREPAGRFFSLGSLEMKP